MAYGDDYSGPGNGQEDNDPNGNHPPGFVYDPAQGTYVPAPSVVGAPVADPAAPTTPPADTTKPVDPPTGDYGTDAAILAQIGKWAAMPGADPSLGKDPNYWLGAIKGKGGLNAGNLQYWQDASVGPSAFFNNPNREGGGASSGSGSGNGSTTTTTPPPTPIAPPSLTPGADPNQQQATDLFNYLIGKAKQSTTVDPNDPMIRSQSDNYTANMTRQGRTYLSELAERKGAGGNIGAESRMVAEKNAQAGAAHEGELIQHESDQRRAEIQQALQLGSQYMTAQQQMALQKELANIDANMKLYQSQVQQGQFGQTFAQNGSQFDATMAQRTQQFNDDLRQRAYEYDTTDEYRRSPYAQPVTA